MIDLFLTIIKEIWHGKGINRVLVNRQFAGCHIGGAILDVGGDGRASIFRFLQLNPGAKVVSVDLIPEHKPDYVLNIEIEKIPLPDYSVDYVLAFGLIEHISSIDNLLAEARRLLKPGGKFLATVPFLVNVHPDPHDYWRLTDEKIIQVMEKAGFHEVSVTAIGSGPFLAAYSLTEFAYPRFLRLLFLPVVWSLDELIRRLKPKIDWVGRYPLSYIIKAKNN